MPDQDKHPQAEPVTRVSAEAWRPVQVTPPGSTVQHTWFACPECGATGPTGYCASCDLRAPSYSPAQHDDGDSNLVRHARAELQRAGLFDLDSDYDGMIGAAVLELVRKFASQGHSGMSAELTLAAFNTVANFKALTPLTSDPEEWMEVGTGVWQNRRQCSVFSKDGGKTWYDIDAPTDAPQEGDHA